MKSSFTKYANQSCHSPSLIETIKKGEVARDGNTKRYANKDSIGIVRYMVFQ